MSDQINLEMPPHLDMVYADQLKSELCAAVNDASIVRIDASAVAQVGSSCAQLLLAASRALDAVNGRLVIAKPTDCFVEALDDLGFIEDVRKWREDDG